MRNKKAKPKIQTRNKSYALECSPLYKLSTKKRLSALLGIPISELRKISKAPHYNVFNQAQKTGKIREIQQPLNQLDVVHTRIASLLSRIETPSYLHSGIKKHSHITNAQQHVTQGRLLTTDIKSFFPSTTQEIIFRFFFYDLKMSEDIAWLITNICCYQSILPTGSRLSMPLAYWANHHMFNEILALCQKHSLSFTLYVDDITISGKNVNELLLNTVSKIVERHGHKLHPNKAKIYNKNDAKIVTGVVLSQNMLYVRNRSLKDIFEDLELWKLIRDTELESAGLVSLKQRLIGRLNAASQIQPTFKDKASTVQNR